MCEFVSWVERRGKTYFLTGDQLFNSDRGRELLPTISPDDYIGHGTIRLYYHIDSGDGVDRECTNFSSPTNFPSEIVEAIKSGKMAPLGDPYPMLTEDATSILEKTPELIEARDAYIKAGAASDEAYTAYSETRDAHLKAQAAYDKGQDTLDEARAAYKEAQAALGKAEDACLKARVAYSKSRATYYRARVTWRNARAARAWPLFADSGNRVEAWR